MKIYMIIAYRLFNGFKCDFKVLEHSNDKERLKYLMTASKVAEYIKCGYIVKIFEEVNA